MKKVLIIIIILLFLVGCGKKDTALNEITNIQENNSNISYVYAKSDSVLMLTDDGNLYAYGDYYGSEKILDKPSIIASNVKKVIPTDFSINYIDNNNNLYYIGYGINGENTRSFKLLSNDILDAAIQYNFCALYIKSDGVYRIGQYPNYCGWNISPLLKEEKYDLQNVKSVFMGDYYSGYINNNDELFLIKQYYNNIEKDYELFMSNVKKVTLNYILTNDNSVYHYNYEYDDSKNVKKLLSSNGQNIYEYAYIADGVLHGHVGDYVDAKEYIIGSYYVDVYINKNNKVVLSKKDNISECDLSIDSMKKIFDFLN